MIKWKFCVLFTKSFRATYISARIAISVIPSLNSLRDFDGVGKLNVLTLGKEFSVHVSQRMMHVLFVHFILINTSR